MQTSRRWSKPLRNTWGPRVVSKITVYNPGVRNVTYYLGAGSNAHMLLINLQHTALVTTARFSPFEQMNPFESRRY